MKKCFNCKELLTLDKFDIDKIKYQLKSDKGTCKVCIECEIERTLNDLSTVKFNYEINKFEVIKFENKEEVKQYYNLKYAKEFNNQSEVGGYFNTVTFYKRCT
jgi:hypothetical protein